MQKIKTASQILSSLVFLLLVVVLGAVNAYRYADFKLRGATDYNEWSAELGSKLETDIGTTFFEKFRLVSVNGAVRNALGQREMNGVWKLNNGRLTMPYMRASDDELHRFADQVARLKLYLEARGIPLVYVMPPSSVSKYDTQTPEGLMDYANDNADRFYRLLIERQIETIDLRERLLADGISSYDMMYKTDHHWTTMAGFYAYRQLAPLLKEKLNCDIDERVADINAYTILNYPAWHLGTYGQRTGVYFGDVDDFDLFAPNFQTLLQLDGSEEIGPLDTIVYDFSSLQARDYTTRQTYDYVLMDGMGERTYRNLECANDKRLLVISDSYYKALNPFLVMSFAEARYTYCMESYNITPEYLDAYAPDAVIVLCELGVLYDGSPAYDYALPIE